MDVRSTLLAALAAVTPLGLTSCVSTWNCHPPKEKFSLDEPLDEQRIDELVEYFGAERREDLTCAQVCNATYTEQRSWQGTDAASCELSLPSETEPGRVQCAGTGFEYYCKGRRPLGHVESGDPDCPDPKGRSLAAMAYLEAASVHAFEELAEQLRGWGAPVELIERCRDAANDERRHARWLTALSTAHGARVPPLRTEPSAEQAECPSLQLVAQHNAVEGCVHETFAALLATRWAERTQDPILQRVFAKIAADELAHGQLAWDLHDWLRAQATPGQQRDIDRAQAAALASLPARASELAEHTHALFPIPQLEVRQLAHELGRRLAA